jgi:uncharacterized membrane protein
MLDLSVHWWLGFVACFLASAVEVVEAVTLVLATGVTRGWRSTWIGVITATITLAVLVVIFGPALLNYIPIGALRVVVGSLLLIFGLQWLRKAIMRYTGMKALHDETLIYQREVTALREAPEAARSGMDWTAFTVAFKGVLLEGLEVIFIVITFGLTAGDNTPALLGSAAAAVLIIIVAVFVRGPLSRVPENTLKYGVGIMLCGFGTFWAAEGLGLAWPGEDWAILGLLAFYLVTSAAMIALLRPRPAAQGQVVGGQT